MDYTGEQHLLLAEIDQHAYFLHTVDGACMGWRSQVYNLRASGSQVEFLRTFVAVSTKLLERVWIREYLAGRLARYSSVVSPHLSPYVTRHIPSVVILANLCENSMALDGGTCEAYSGTTGKPYLPCTSLLGVQ